MARKNGYFTLAEKRSFIDTDFMNSKLCQMDPLPEDRDERRNYFQKAVDYGNEFVNKYRGKGWSHDYAMEVVQDWINSLDALARGMNHETN